MKIRWKRRVIVLYVEDGIIWKMTSEGGPTMKKTDEALDWIDKHPIRFWIAKRLGDLIFLILPFWMKEEMMNDE